MSLSINNNITALNAWRNLKTTDMRMTNSMEKLSSGLRINRAADDPAGLVISEKMRAQLSGLGAATKNVEKAVNMVSTAEGALDKVNELLLKMRALAVDTANLGVTDSDMAKANQSELDEAIASITRIAENTQFGTKKLLDGTASGAGALIFQVGANASQNVSVQVTNMKASALAHSGGFAGSWSNNLALSAGQASARGLQALASYSVLAKAVSLGAGSGGMAALNGAIMVIDEAIDSVASTRGELGAVQSNNLEVSLDSLRVSYENLQAAESTIRDADMTQEMAEFTKYQIMMQAGTAMLAQANQMPNNILQLLR